MLKKFALLTLLMLWLCFSYKNGSSQYQWFLTSHEYNDAQFFRLAVSGTTLFAGHDGVYSSTDYGSTWFPVNNGLPQISVWVITVSGANIFVGGAYGNIYLSTNNGANWTISNSGMPVNCNVYDIISSGSDLFAATSTYGVYKSTNNGANWFAVNNGLTITGVYRLCASGTNIFAGSASNAFINPVFLTTNGGESWSLASGGLPSNSYVRAFCTSGSYIFAAMNGNPLYRTTNNGTNWISCGLGSYSIGALMSSGGYVFAAIGLSDGIFRSSNNGSAWQTVNNGLLLNNYFTAFTSSGSTIFVSSVYEIFRTTNYGANWINASNFVKRRNVNALIFFNGALYQGTQYDIFKTTNDGNNWIKCNSGMTNSDVRALAGRNENLFAGTYGGGVFKSTDNGANWSAANNGLANLNIFSLFVAGVNLFAGTYGGGVFKSTNNGANWSALNNGLTNLNVQAFLAKDTSGINLYAGTAGGGVNVSTNGGANWYPAAALPNQNVLSLISFNSDIFAGTNGNGIFKSTNNGLNWSAQNSGLTNLYVRTFLKSGAYLFAGTDSGVFLSSDNGANWLCKNQYISYLWPVHALETGNNYIFAGSYGYWVWRRLFSQIVEIENTDKEIPSAFSLKQNYPNPFNPVTKISFSIPLWRGEGGRNTVILKVYDITGREVQTLVNEELQPGTYKVTFNGSEMNSGVYFYKLTAGDYNETKKMVLVK